MSHFKVIRCNKCQHPLHDSRRCFLQSLHWPCTHGAPQGMYWGLFLPDPLKCGIYEHSSFKGCYTWMPTLYFRCNCKILPRIRCTQAKVHKKNPRNHSVNHVCATKIWKKVTYLITTEIYAHLIWSPTQIYLCLLTNWFLNETKTEQR